MAVSIRQMACLRRTLVQTRYLWWTAAHRRVRGSTKIAATGCAQPDIMVDGDGNPREPRSCFEYL